MLSKRSSRSLAVAGLAAWACALPEQSAPPDGGAPSGGTGNPTGGSTTGGSTTGGSTTGGSTTGGSTTGGSATGGSTTGGSTTGGTMTGGSSTGGTTGGAGTGTGGSAGSATGGTMSGAGGRGGAGGAGAGGTAGSSAGMGGTMAGAGMGGKAGTGGSAGGGVLVHRYSFEGTGMTATDSIGTAHGTITGGSQSGGSVTLSGTEQYVTLPNTLLSGLTAATFEAWVSWTGGTSNWQRIFDFGNNEGTSGDQGGSNAAAQYIFLTPRAQATTNTNCTESTAGLPRVAITGSGPANESCVLAPSAFPSGSTHVAVTVNDSTIALYIQGAAAGTPVTPAFSLASIYYSHNWLGRSQFSADSEFAGTISEFRIYGTARTAAQIQSSYSAGENSVPTQ